MTIKLLLINLFIFFKYVGFILIAMFMHRGKKSKCVKIINLLLDTCLSHMKDFTIIMYM